MPKNIQKQAEEAKSCMKVKNGKAIKNNRKNVMKSQTKQGNQNCKNFVTLNKRKIIEKIGGKLLENIEEIEKKGIFYLNILVLYIV